MKVTLFIASLLMIFSNQLIANDRCPAGDSGCTMSNWEGKMGQVLSSGTQDYANDSSTYETGISSVFDRVKNVGSIVKDCAECGTDALLDGINSVTNDEGVR